ncbi:lycopene cyclase family protein [Nocardiopsis coralliicola]
MSSFDVLIVGAGAAGLSLALAAGGLALPGGRAPEIGLVEPPAGGPRAPDRTWCYWERGPGPWDGLLAARWEKLAVRGPEGATVAGPIAPHSYKMLRSRDFEDHVRSRLPANVEPVTATASRIDDGAEHAAVQAERADGTQVRLRARWVFDTRPAPLPRPARTTLLQHFRGWFLRTDADAFDAETALLMDLRLPQPRGGVAFGYVLPLSARSALVEYTEFTRTVLDDAGYTAALRHYTGDVLGLEGAAVTAVEQGAIPMTDGRFIPRAGRRVFRLGAAGGATRPSTGYTFSGIQRQVAAVARALEEGRTPVPPVPHRRRHLAMDAVLLRALDAGRVRGDAFFAGLFARNSMVDVLDFLDGRTTLRRELAIGATTPVAPMAATVVERLLGRPR